MSKQVIALCAGVMLLNNCGKKETTPPPNGQVSIQFLDVGQGDAILVRSPEGKTLLIDGGKSQSIMREQMAAHNISKIDVMVASHFDMDHIGGLIAAADAQPTYFINNGIAATTQAYQKLVNALEAQGTIFQKANNQTIKLGSAEIQVIAPPEGVGDDQNLNSVGIAVRFGNFRALMTGDSEKRETSAWLEEGRPDVKGPFQVYKSIHHGASNGDHADWLASVQPENVVISVGDNSYGHPTREALALYRKTGAKVYRTDQQGTITFTASGDGQYTVKTERP